MYDVKPEYEDDPALTTHFARQRQKTLDAIKRGLDEKFLVASEYTDAVAADVLASLEQLWRDGETFT